MNALYIEGRRSGYSPDGCGKTLTVGELIEILSDFDEDLPRLSPQRQRLHLREHHRAHHHPVGRP